MHILPSALQNFLFLPPVTSTASDQPQPNHPLFITSDLELCRPALGTRMTSEKPTRGRRSVHLQAHFPRIG